MTTSRPSDAAANATAAGKQPTLDRSRLDQLFALQAATGKDFVGELIRLFHDDTPKRLATLREALAAGDRELVERMAHSLKGSSGNIGALALQARAYELEQRAADGLLEGGEELLTEIEAELSRVCEALAEARKDSDPGG